MEVRPGYKQTEVGVIPEDWEVKRIVDFASVGSGGTPSREVAAYWGGSIPWVTTSQIDFGAITEADQFITDEGLRNSAAKLLPAGTLLMALYGQGKTRGKVGVLGMPAATNQACASIALHEGVSREFILHFLTSRYEDIRNSSNSGSQENLNGNIVKGTPVAFPPPSEQRAIAAALSDMDALLGGLDRLIAKKRDLKQAAMQQLLTGQTRLPGFGGEWEVKRLGDLFKFSGGYSASRDQLSTDGYCYLHYGDIHGYSKTTIDTKADHQDIPKLDIPLKRVSPDSLLADGDVVFVDASEDDEGTSKHVVVVNKGGLPFISGLHTIIAKARTAELAHEYLRHCFQTAAIRRQFMFYAVGTKVSGISKTNIAKLTLPVPSVPEQTAIAAILSDMDAELSKLEARRDKTRDLKQAMMQELLTGRTRLVEPISNVLPVDFSEKPKPAAGQPLVAGTHNWVINEAVVVAVLVKQFGSAQYPLGRKRCTKLSYLLHRHVEHVAQGYLKKAAGPYNPAVKYKGPEGIAQKNGYIRTHTQGNFAGFVAAEKVAQAEGYFEKWYGSDVLAWLEQFRFKSNDELELLATVDMAAEDLRRAGRPVGVDAVKSVIRSHPEWEAKLEREIFSDANLARGIAQTRELF